MNDIVLHSLPAEETLLNTAEAAEYLRLSTPSLKLMAQSGKLPFVRLGSFPNSPRKYRLSDLQVFVKGSVSK